MSFKEQLLERFDEVYKEGVFLESTFKELSTNLEKFREELKKYPVDVYLKKDSNLILLVLQGEMIRVELDFDYMRIQVIADDDEYNDTRIIDTITYANKGKGISPFWNLGSEKAFDYYLEKAFKSIID